MRRAELQLLLDAGEAGRQQAGEGQIGIEIGAADAAFDADRFDFSPHSRKPAVRLSRLQTALVGAKVPTWKRL